MLYAFAVESQFFHRSVYICPKYAGKLDKTDVKVPPFCLSKRGTYYIQLRFRVRSFVWERKVLIAVPFSRVLLPSRFAYT